MKIKSFLLAFFVIVISCGAYSQDSTKTTVHHHTAMTHHHTGVTYHKHHKHRKHVIKEGSKADRKEDKKEAVEKKAATEKKSDKK